MVRVKLSILLLVATAAVGACLRPQQNEFVIASSNAYEASIFRQQCAVCHGSEAKGKVLDDGKVVPNLRVGDFRKRTEAEIYKQIAEGGNGMTPFRGMLSERELRLMTDFVRRDLRGQ